jgi:hypothetical protein
VDPWYFSHLFIAIAFYIHNGFAHRQDLEVMDELLFLRIENSHRVLYAWMSDYLRTT